MAGFQPIQYLSGAAWNGQARSYPISTATAGSIPINAGDPVCLLATGFITAASIGGLLPANTQPIGVFVSCTYKLLGGLLVTNSNVFPAVANAAAFDMTVPPTAQVVDDYNVLYSLQMPSNAALLQTNVGNNAQYTFPGTPVTNGQSGVLLDPTNMNTTATFFLKIIGLAPNQITFTNAVGNSYPVPNAYGVNGNNALVLFNGHAYKGAGTLGV